MPVDPALLEHVKNPDKIDPEKTEETTTIIYQQDADTMLQILYGENSEEDGQGDK